MSELREECYKCLNNQSCPGAADYGSILCMTKRKFKMPRNEEDGVYAHKFAVMQQEMAEKDKRIKELEEENYLQRKQIMSAYDKGWIPVQKIKDKIEEIEKEYNEIISEYGNIDTDVIINVPDKNVRKYLDELVIKILVLQELLEDK